MPNTDHFSLMVYGPYGCGKTHLQGDFLRWASKQGKGPIHFLNFGGQDGYTTLKGMGLGEVGETVENLKDYYDALEDYKKEKTFALAVDGLHDVTRFELLDMFNGELRYPDPKKDGERAKMLWGQLKWAIYQDVLKSKSVAPYVMWVAPHDKGEDPITGTTSLTPDMIGKTSQACVGWFDLVGYMTAQSMGPGKVVRKVTVKQNNAILTRQRLPKEITEDIEIPQDSGGFEAIFKRVQRSLGVEK